MSNEPRQTTLSGGERTQVGEKDEYKMYSTPLEISNKHSMVNTPISENGWIGNPYPKKMYGREQCIERFEKNFV